MAGPCPHDEQEALSDADASAGVGELIADRLPPQTPQQERPACSAVLNLYATHMDYLYSCHPNSAAAPLLVLPVGQHFCVCPILTSSVTRVLSVDATSRSSPVPTLLVVQPPTPPHAEPATVQGPSPDGIPSSSGASGSEPYVQRNPRAS